MTDIWGPWINASAGNGVRGYYAQVEFSSDVRAASGVFNVNDRTVEGLINEDAKVYCDDKCRPVSYRIRKPKGMTILEQLVKNPERELEDV